MLTGEMEKVFLQRGTELKTERKERTIYIFSVFNMYILSRITHPNKAILILSPTCSTPKLLLDPDFLGSMSRLLFTRLSAEEGLAGLRVPQEGQGPQ